MIPELPLEVQFAILSLLDGREDALNCTLVCKAWVPTARSLAFSTHKVDVLRVSDRLKIPDSFIDIITHPHCTIREALSQVSICRVREDVLRVDNDTACERIVNVLIEHVSRIEGLTFNWTPGRPAVKLTPALTLLSSTSSSLRTLELLHFDLWDLPNLLNVLGDAQCLTSLKILTFRPRDEDSSISFSTPPPSLQTVSTNVATRSFLDAFLVSDASPVRRLDVLLQDAHAIEVMGTSLKRHQGGIAQQRFLCLEPLLRRDNAYEAMSTFLSTPECAQGVNRWIVDLSECFFSISEHDGWNLDLSLTTKLQSIKMIFPLGYFDVDDHNPSEQVLSSISQTLSSVPAVVAAELGIELEIQLFDNTRGNETLMLDRMLDEFLEGILGRTAGVVVVTLECRWLKGEFPSCYARSQRTGNLRLELQ